MDADGLSQLNADLVIRVRGGDPSAFDTLVRQHYGAAYATALAILCHRENAEDVVQEAFLTALEKIDDCTEPQRFTGWLLQIVRNRAKNVRRYLHVRRTSNVEERDCAEEHSDPNRRTEENEEGERLLQALSGLRPTQRCIVLLHDLEGWRHQDIAEVLEISPELSRQHLFLARRWLQAQMQPSVSAGEPT